MSQIGQYSLATGEAAVRRLNLLHRTYGPGGRWCKPGLLPQVEMDAIIEAMMRWIKSPAKATA